MSTRLFLFALGTLVLAGCTRIDEPVTATTTPDRTYRPECPHDWPDTLQFGEHGAAASPAVLTGPGVIKNVPEFHDCQRFMVPEGAGTRYDSLFAIFATYRLNRLDTLWLAYQQERVSGEGEKRDQAAGDPGSQTSQFGGLWGGEALPAAEIVAWNAYPPLNIREGFNCLYLFLRADANGAPAWFAKMVSFGNTEQDCSQSVDPDTLPSVPGPDVLHVRTEQHPRLGNPDDYPAVARWDWDDRKGTHYIGIRCGAAWCSVAKAGLTPSATPAERLPDQGGSLATADLRAHHVKGWYDEQYLAVPGTSGNLPATSRIKGTLIPVPELGTLDLPAFDKTWVQTAWVALEVPAGVANPYEAKFNLWATPPGQVKTGMNTVFLCSGAVGECPGVPTTTAACGDGHWWVKVVNPSGTEMYRCSHRREMTGVTIPGTVRWRWLLEDEGMWMRCPRGCCDMTEM